MLRKQTAEDPFAHSKAVGDGGARAFGCGIRRAPRSEMLFRPEEVDRRSQGVKGFALLVDSLPEPEHDAVGFWRRTLRRRGERQGRLAVMATGANLYGVADHRRDAERVGRAERVSVLAVGKSDDERRRRGRKGVGDVDLTSADPNQVVVIKGDESIMERIGLSAWRSRDDVLDRDRPALLKEGLQDEPHQRLLTSRAASSLPRKRVQGLQLVGREDQQVRQCGPPFSVEIRVKSGVTTGSRGIFRGGEADGGDGPHRHRGVGETYADSHRDDPLLRTDRLAACSGSKLRRLPAVWNRPPQAPELHPACPNPRVLNRGGPHTPPARGRKETALR